MRSAARRPRTAAASAGNRAADTIPALPATPVDGHWALARYEQIRSRLPRAAGTGAAQAVPDLWSLRERFDAFLFDGYGVLNLGPAPIAGASRLVRRLRADGGIVRVLTNAASETAPAQVARYHALGFDFSAAEIVSSRAVLIGALAAEPPSGRWGVLAAADGGLRDLPLEAVRLPADAAEFDHLDGLILLSSKPWNRDLHAQLSASLARRPRPLLVANPDLVAPQPQGMSLEPGGLAHALADQLGLSPVFYGKPFANAFEAARAGLPGGIPGERILMLGDSLHTDILGAAAAGIASALVTGHGLLRGLDPRRWIAATGIRPDYVMHSIGG